MAAVTPESSTSAPALPPPPTPASTSIPVSTPVATRASSPTPAPNPSIGHQIDLRLDTILKHDTNVLKNFIKLLKTPATKFVSINDTPTLKRIQENVQKIVADIKEQYGTEWTDRPDINEFRHTAFQITNIINTQIALNELSTLIELRTENRLVINHAI
jgi:hypothetical protein